MDNNFNNQIGGIPNNEMPMNNMQNSQMNTINSGVQPMNQVNYGYQNDMRNNQMNYNNGQTNMYNQVNTNGFQNNQGNFVNQPNMMYQQNNQFVQNNVVQKKVGTFGGLCVSSFINFIIFTIAVFLFGSLLFSFLLNLLGLQSTYTFLELMEEKVADQFYTKQILSAVLSGVVYGGMYMLSIRYIVKSRLKKKSYSLQNIRKYKVVAIIMSVLMLVVMNFSLFASIDSTYEEAKDNVSNISSLYDTAKFDKVLESYATAKLVAGITLSVFAALTIIISLKIIKKNEMLLNSNMSYNVSNANYISS